MHFGGAMKRTAILTFAILAASAMPLAAQPATPAYQVTKTVALGAPDRWD
jgi:hypothetical protein